MFLQPDFLRLVRARPFQPFRIHVSDGAHYDVRHPELLNVGKNYLIVGIPSPDEPDAIFEYDVRIAIVHVSRVEMLNHAVAAAKA